MASRSADKKAEQRLKVLDEVMAGINKDMGSGSIMKLGENKHANVNFISTGSLVMDNILGGGLARGRVIEFFGPESSGKTTAALVAAGNVQRDGGNVAFIDVEHALDPAQARRLGVDTDKLIFSQPSSAEQALGIVDRLCESGAVDLIILDSTAALAPEAELEGKIEDQQVGLLARVMSKSLRRITQHASSTGTVVIFINQTREKIGVFYGNPETTPGGKALKFYTSQRMRISRIGSIKDPKDKDRIIANKVEVKCVKNKVAPPFGKGTTVINFTKGIDINAEVEQVVVEEMGLIHKVDGGGNKMYDNDGNLIATSRKALAEKFQTEPEFVEQWKIAALDYLQHKQPDENDDDYHPIDTDTDDTITNAAEDNADE